MGGRGGYLSKKNDYPSQLDRKIKVKRKVKRERERLREKREKESKRTWGNTALFIAHYMISFS